MADIAQSICEAITTIVDKSISEAGYDKTIQGKITGTIDSTIGSYRVSYQDSTFTAYSTSTDVTYTTGSTVYVLVPSGDFSNDKTIVGTVKKLGINYVSTVEGKDAYDINGVSVVTSSDTFTLSSYGGAQAKVLYSKDNEASENLITVDFTAIDQYIKTSSIIICGITVKTSIPTINQYSGDYGIIFALDFEDNATGDVITRYYTINVDKMSGNPYKLITATEQYGIFDIDGANFKEVNYISLFCYDFPNSNDDPEDDIFISDITLCGAEPLSSEDLDNYSLTFTTPRGTYFTENNGDTLTLIAQVRVKGKIIDNDSQSLAYYWFTENSGITATSLYYNRYGGKGWKCLNDYTIIDSDENVVEWVSGNYQLIIKRNDVLASSVTYKCAVVYDNTVLTKTIIIKNLSSKYDITIESDSGTQFYFDIGNPTLTCYVNGEEFEEYTYSWSQTTYDGVYSALTNSSEDNNGQKIENNKIYNVNVSAITTWTKYTCTVTNGELYLGTASITILNSLETEGTYSLIINNGSHVYKYNENGVSPASDSIDNPIEIEALTFTVYNNLGEAIDNEVISHCSIKWIVPTVNTLITVPSAYTATETTDTTATYSNMTSFSYGISNKYNISKTNNNITLMVDYKGLILSSITDLTFTKEGENGTNGTEYTCRIVPNVSSVNEAPPYLIMTWLNDNTVNLESNYTPLNGTSGNSKGGQWFKVRLWNNEVEILNSTGGTSVSDEGINAIVTWSLLRNKYTSSISDPTCIEIKDSDGKTVTSSSTGVFAFGSYKTASFDENENVVDPAPAYIVKATVDYNNVTYYATLPIIAVKLNNNDYRITLKENTGFLYAIYTSDGTNPTYNSTNPFEIIVTNDNNEDISDNENLTYKWKYLGTVYDSDSKEWINHSYLTDGSEKDLKNNQKSVKPSSTFNGQCVTNAIECTVSFAGIEIGSIYIPIHLYLNRYGLSALNGWDGNSITINEEGGFILAPQVGAGVKNDDNTFTGIVMGEVQESNKSSSDAGLFGYASGVRSIFLDASTGGATFGEAGKSQIIIDPSNNKAQLYSGNYVETTNSTAGSGMMIDLTTPEIKYGSGNFSVNSSGYLTAKGGGSIAGFNIDNNAIWSETEYTNGTTGIRLASAGFERKINGTTVKYLRLALGENFGVDTNGEMYAASGVIGSGSNKITLGKSSGSDSYSAIYSKKSSFKSENSGFYIGTDGIALGSYSPTYETSKFQVTDEGELTARAGYIGNGSKGWTIGNTSLTNGKTGFQAAPTDESKEKGVYIGTDGISLGAYDETAGTSNFQVSSSGKLVSKSGTIGGWTISSNSLTSTSSTGNIAIKSSGSIEGGYSGNQWSISASGSVSFNYGTIGGWTISSNSLYANKLTLNASLGSISNTNGNWSIDGSGDAYFNKVSIAGGSITGTSYNGTGSGTTTILGSGNTYVNSDSQSLSKYIESLVVDTLDVSSTFTFQNKTCKWQDIDYIKSVDFSYNTGTVNGKQVITSVSFSYTPGSIYVLTAKTTGTPVTVTKPGGSSGELLM